ncbi:substrate-binding periplasmic protein [Sneathiella limimaris]|uniref:substrate-binding periplasmic protein n=1 Tax=Sneathiella limimaris TaxID=1964213 RepID=UPI00146A685E|nr:transporter substrate-binding domain-containing protein [Sneathiella limimaris]
MVRIASFICAIAIAFNISNAATASDSTTIYTSYFPSVVIDDPDKPGIAYEIVTELFKLAKEEYTIVHLPWARAQHMALQTPGSLIFPLSRTPTRDDKYVWDLNIFNNNSYFITFNNVKLTAETARDKHIGVQLKSSWDNWLTEQGYKNVYRVPGDGSELIKLLRNKRIDAWYTDQIIGSTALRGLEDPGITFSEPIKFFRTYLATNRKNPYPHMEKLRAALKVLQESGRIDEIFKKYGLIPN